MTGKNNSWPTVARVRELLAYDHEKGVLTWRVQAGSRKPGQRAGTCTARTLFNDQKPVASVRVDGRLVTVSRLCFLHYWGFLPAGVNVRFVNGNQEDIRIVNFSYRGFEPDRLLDL